MPITTMTTTINEDEIREAIAAWLAAQNAGDGPRVDPHDIEFQEEDGEAVTFRIVAVVDH